MSEHALETYKRSFHLLCPGPVNVHPDVAAALTSYAFCHREEEFCALFEELQRNILRAAGLPDASTYTAVVLTGSGTAANETVLSSAIPAEAPVLVLANGEFGERLAALSRLYHPNTHCILHDWATPIDLARVEHHLQHNPTALVAMVHHETSSGMLNPVEAVGKMAARAGARFFVDAVSSFTADPLDLKAAHIDLMSTSAEKAIGSYPGLSIVIGTHEVFQACAAYAPRSQYLNLHRYYDFAQRVRQTPNTPAVPLFLALNRALELALEEGIPTRHARFRSRNLSIRARLASLGLRPLLPDEHNSSTLTSVFLPEGVAFEPLRQSLRAAGFVMYEGKGPLRNRIFQVSALGVLSDDTLDAFFACLATLLPPPPKPGHKQPKTQPHMPTTSAPTGREVFLRDLKLIPNLLCIYRIVVIVIGALLAISGYPLTGLSLGVTAGLTDYLDGYLARKWNQCTELGALLDGMADLLFAFICFLVAVNENIWPLYIFLLWGLRDISIAFVRTSAAQLGFTIPSIFLGKLASNFNFYAFVFMGLDIGKPFGYSHFMADVIHWVGLGGIHAGIAMQWISGGVYLRRYINGYRTQTLGEANRDAPKP